MFKKDKSLDMEESEETQEVKPDENLVNKINIWRKNEKEKKWINTQYGKKYFQ